MTINELFFAISGLFLTVFFGFAAGFKLYLDAKVDPIKEQMEIRFNIVDKKLDFLLEHFTDHESRLSKQEEKTKNL